MNHNNNTNYLNLVNELINYYRNNDIMPGYNNNINNTNRQSFFYPSSTSNNSNRSLNSTNSNLDILTIIDDYNYNVSQYNSNFREYQSNLRYLIDLYILEQSTTRRQQSSAQQQQQQQQQQQYRYRPTTSTRTTASGHTYTTRQTNIPRQTRNQITQNLPIVERLNIIISDIFQDVIIRPSIDQINIATTCFPYNFDASYNQCSITMEEFEENEIVCKIKHCGHTFKKNAIMNWFERSVRCPICRYDIRNYREPMNSNEDEHEHEDENNNESAESEENDSSNVDEPDSVDNDDAPGLRPTITNVIENELTNVANEIINNFGDDLTNNITQILQTYMNNTDASNRNVETTFEFPIIYYQPYRNNRTL